MPRAILVGVQVQLGVRGEDRAVPLARGLPLLRGLLARPRHAQEVPPTQPRVQRGHRAVRLAQVSNKYFPATRNIFDGVLSVESGCSQSVH